MAELSTTVAAERAGVSRRHIALLIRRGELEARREETPRGPLLWVTEEALARWMARRKPAGRPPKSPPQEEARA